jgi:hypothetical protein
MKQGRTVPYYLIDENDMPVAGAAYHPQWKAMSTIAGYEARPLGDGEFMEYYLELFNRLDVRRTIDTSVQISGYCRVNTVWTNERLFTDGMVVEHSLDLTNHHNLTTLPNNMTIKGDLKLARTGLTQLPTNLSVEGCLDIRFTSIWTRPDGLSAGSINTSGGKQI